MLVRWAAMRKKERKESKQERARLAYGRNGTCDVCSCILPLLILCGSFFFFFKLLACFSSLVLREGYAKTPTHACTHARAFTTDMCCVVYGMYMRARRIHAVKCVEYTYTYTVYTRPYVSCRTCSTGNVSNHPHSIRLVKGEKPRRRLDLLNYLGR